MVSGVSELLHFVGFPALPRGFRLYDALAFLARGDVLSSHFTTPLVAPPDGTKEAE